MLLHLFQMTLHLFLRRKFISSFLVEHLLALRSDSYDFREVSPHLPMASPPMSGFQNQRRLELHLFLVAFRGYGIS